MRLRLVHALSLLLIAAVLLAVVAMGAVTAWNLSNGFAHYLAARDAERLEQFASLAAGSIEQAGGLEALRQRSPDMRELLEQFGQSQGLPQRRPPSLEAGAMPERPPPGGAEGFASRLAVVRVDGGAVFDRPTLLDQGAYIDRPIRVRGETVALARLRASGRMPDAVEMSFLQRQYLGIVAVSALLVLIALASAWYFARCWVRPVQAVQQATARIAQGDFAVRVALSDHHEAGDNEMGDLVRDVNRMAENLHKMERTRQRWGAEISHELRTPLAVLRGELEAMIDGVRPLNSEAVRSLHEEVLQLGALVDDLHLLAMSDLDALPCQYAEMDALVLVRQSLQRYEGRAAASGLVLKAALPQEACLPVYWDSTRIEQLLSNMLENSIRYTDAPGQIMLTLRHVKDRIAITIEDTTPGVPLADLPHVFEPLYRADAARSRHRGGSGLGLAICATIVKRHGGCVEATSSALGGLRLHISLPVNAEGAR